MGVSSHARSGHGYRPVHPSTRPSGCSYAMHAAAAFACVGSHARQTRFLNTGSLRASVRLHRVDEGPKLQDERTDSGRMGLGRADRVVTVRKQRVQRVQRARRLHVERVEHVFPHVGGSGSSAVTIKARPPRWRISHCLPTPRTEPALDRSLASRPQSLPVVLSNGLRSLVGALQGLPSDSSM